MNKNLIVIHPNDPSTAFLKILYDYHSPFNPLLIDETTSTSKIRQILTAKALKDRPVLMLGHGYSGGMFAPQKVGGEIDQFYRKIINPRLVQFLRERTCIGIWCHAKMFAERYGLHGLFSGMIISDKDEANNYCMDEFTQKEIEMYNVDFAGALEYCLETYDLREIPHKMSGFKSVQNRLEEFNFSNLHYYP